MEDCPTIRSEDLSVRAEDFAADLVARLTEFNERNPDPEEMSEEERQRLEDQRDRIPRLTPEQMKPLFEGVFCQYMSSHYGIVPADRSLPGQAQRQLDRAALEVQVGSDQGVAGSRSPRRDRDI